MPRDLALPAAEQPHVWWLHSGELIEARSFASSEDLQRAARFDQPADGARFLEGRAFVRLVLGSYMGVPAPREIRFESELDGKPRLRDAPGALDFSFSKSPGLCAVAVATGARVGLDVELETRLRRMRRALLRALSPQDASHPTYKDGKDLETLLENWVVKEALLKAVGLGLSRDPGQIYLGDGFGQESFLWRAESADPDFGDSSWTVTSLSIAPGYVTALATEGEVKEVLIRRFVT